MDFLFMLNCLCFKWNLIIDLISYEIKLIFILPLSSFVREIPLKKFIKLRPVKVWLSPTWRGHLSNPVWNMEISLGCLFTHIHDNSTVSLDWLESNYARDCATWHYWIPCWIEGSINKFAFASITTLINENNQFVYFNVRATDNEKNKLTYAWTTFLETQIEPQFTPMGETHSREIKQNTQKKTIRFYDLMGSSMSKANDVDGITTSAD